MSSNIFYVGHFHFSVVLTYKYNLLVFSVSLGKGLLDHMRMVTINSLTLVCRLRCLKILTVRMV